MRQTAKPACAGPEHRVRHHKLIVAGIDAKAPDEAQQHLRTRLSGKLGYSPRSVRDSRNT
jgi:hypothetical protein